MAIEYVPVPPKNAAGPRFTRSTLTPFGEEVGNDEIQWWVWKQEQDPRELALETERVIPSVQKIIEKLKGWDFASATSYDAIVAGLESLTDSLVGEIDSLMKYALFLKKRAALAPSMLLANRVWHSSPLSDRSVAIESNDYEHESVETRQNIIECVYGLRFAGRSIPNFRLIMARMDNGTRPAVLIAAKEAQDAMLTYFRSLKSCLENVLLEIEHLYDLENSAHDEDFWREFIKISASSGKAESDLYDFKETLQYWRVAKVETESAKIKFAMDVAAFANNHGGALIIGVRDGANREITGVPFLNKELENKIKSISQVLDQYLNRDKVTDRVCQVEIDGHLCIVIVIAQSKEVIRVRTLEGHFVYPLRRACESVGVEPDEVLNKKRHVKRHSYLFIRELRRVVGKDQVIPT